MEQIGEFVIASSKTLDTFISHQDNILRNATGCLLFYNRCLNIIGGGTGGAGGTFAPPTSQLGGHCPPISQASTYNIDYS